MQSNSNAIAFSRAEIRIPWTKLKTVPIQLQLDEIRSAAVDIEENQYALIKLDLNSFPDFPYQ